MLILFLALPLWAQVVALSTPQTNPLDYENHLLQNPNQISFVQHHYKNQERASKELYRQLKMAQFYFLDGQLDLAQKSFQKITDMAHIADWGEKERQALHFSFLRRAQLTSHAKSSHKLLIQALGFDSEQTVDDQVFPPPLVQQYKQLLRQKKSQVFALPPHASEFDQVLINGKVQMGAKSFLKIPKQEVRITFLSNIYKPQSFVTLTNKLQDLKLPLVSLVTGSCENPNWDKTLFQGQKIQRIWPGCQNSKSLALPTLIEEKNTTPTPSHSNFRFLKSKWFWAGVSILATGAILHHHNQKGRSTPAPIPKDSSTEVTILSNK